MIIPSALEENVAAARWAFGQHILASPSSHGTAPVMLSSEAADDAGQLETKGAGVVLQTDLNFLLRA